MDVAAIAVHSAASIAANIYFVRGDHTHADVHGSKNDEIILNQII